MSHRLSKSRTYQEGSPYDVTEFLLMICNLRSNELTLTHHLNAPQRISCPWHFIRLANFICRRQISLQIISDYLPASSIATGA